MRCRVVVCVAIASLGVGACIIGPKQDDPVGADVPDSGDDLGAASDTGAAPTDTGTTPTTTPDAGGLADASGDAAPPPADAAVDGDAGCGDGSVPLTAIGPWSDTKKCWETTVHSFECVAGIDGGTLMTCFVRISTGELFLAPSTHIPSGSDYRACTAAEQKSPTDRCK